MLKETENEETRLFWQIFIVGGILIEGARVPSATPYSYANDFETNRSPMFFHKENI